jgi:hypothetical protein
MKKNILFFAFIIIGSAMQAQLKTTKICPALSVDILDGRVNELRITDNITQIKTKLPCYSNMEEESTTAKCGGGIFYKDQDVYFYTSRDYVEIGPKFKGKLSLPLMGASRTSLYKWLGNARIKDVTWDAFTTQYGILILYYTKANKVNKIQFSTKSTDTINLCE